MKVYLHVTFLSHFFLLSLPANEIAEGKVFSCACHSVRMLHVPVVITHDALTSIYRNAHWHHPNPPIMGPPSKTSSVRNNTLLKRAYVWIKIVDSNFYIWYFAEILALYFSITLHIPRDKYLRSWQTYFFDKLTICDLFYFTIVTLIF